MKLVLNLVVCGMLFSSFSFAAESQNAQTENTMSVERPYNVWAQLGLGISGLSVGGLSDISFGFQGSLNAGYYLAPNVGVFTGLSYQNYILDTIGTDDPSVAFIDVPFGLSFKYENGFIQGAKNFLNVGGYVGFGLGDLEIATLALKSKTPVGLFVSSLMTFPVGGDFRVGIGSEIKYAFTDVVAADTSAFAINFGFAFLY